MGGGVGGCKVEAGERGGAREGLKGEIKAKARKTFSSFKVKLESSNKTLRYSATRRLCIL